MIAVDRRLFCGTALGVLAGRVLAQSLAELDGTGRFELIPGNHGIVIGVPHATSDAGTREVGQILCRKTGASGVLVSGFWDGTARRRVNVNRPTEQLISTDSEVTREWQTDRARSANARYEAMVKQASGGALRAFYEIHSNHRPRFAGSIEVSTQGVSRPDAVRFKDAFIAARDGLGSSAPRLEIHVSPVDRVTYPNYPRATSIAQLAERGCAIEHPAGTLAERAWRQRYAECLAAAILSAQWGRA